MKKLIRPSLLGKNVPTDNRRYIYDIMNSVVIDNKTAVDICFIGDSITEFWELNVYFKEYGTIINRGIGGDTPQGVLHRFKGDVIQLKPKVCVLMIGVNEVWQYTDMYNYFKTEEETRAEQAKKIENLEIVYKKIFKLCKDNKIILLPCSVMPLRQNHEKPFDQSNSFIDGLNIAIKRLATDFGFEYVDYNSLMKDELGALREDLTWDSAHPHAKGYNIMSRELKTYLDRIFTIQR